MVFFGSGLLGKWSFWKLPFLEVTFWVNGLFGNDISLIDFYWILYIPFSRLVMLEVESSQTHLRKLILFPVFKIFLTQLSDKNLGIMDFLMEYLSNLKLVKGWVSKSRTFFSENLAYIPHIRQNHFEVPDVRVSPNVSTIFSKSKMVKN